MSMRLAFAVVLLISSFIRFSFARLALALSSAVCLRKALANLLAMVVGGLAEGSDGGGSGGSVRSSKGLFAGTIVGGSKLRKG